MIILVLRTYILKMSIGSGNYKVRMRKRRLQSRYAGECSVKETKEKEYFRI